MPVIAENKIDRHIVEFMIHQTVMTLATCNRNIPHCAMCFYVFIPEHNIIVFKSKASTIHVQQALINNAVAGSILPDKFNQARTSGIQLYGNFKTAADETYVTASKHYYKKYPFAAVMPGELYMIELTEIIFTDARLGIGKRRHWQKET